MTPTDERHEVTLLVREVITAVLPSVPPSSITGDRHLRDLGADSVDRVEIILSLLGRLGLDVPLSYFSDVPGIDALIDELLSQTRHS